MSKEIIPIERIAQSIRWIRGQKVLLDSDLAALYGVTTADPWALASASALLVVAGLLAALVPAIRASRVDPALVLRER